MCFCQKIAAEDMKSYLPTATVLCYVTLLSVIMLRILVVYQIIVKYLI